MKSGMAIGPIFSLTDKTTQKRYQCRAEYSWPEIKRYCWFRTTHRNMAAFIQRYLHEHVR